MKKSHLFSIIVKDILHDLSEKIGDVREEVEEAVEYSVIPITHYQRRMRKNSNEFRVWDHATRELKPIDQRRIEILSKLHPTIEICDWRFLRNRQETLSDGTRTLSLKYENDRPYGKVLNHPKSNTIIPWRFANSGDKNGQYAGCYGRLLKDGYFDNILTDVNPGKSRIVHPNHPRVVTMRELARAQGFPDNFRFFGKYVARYRMIGNAVPIPLAYSIGVDIRRSYCNSKDKPRRTISEFNDVKVMGEYISVEE